MRSTCSVYIDAGYLLTSAATRITGTSLRNGIHVDFAPLIASLIGEAEKRSGLPVLRVHWYDSARNGIPDAQQERIGELPKVKLRLGRFGVDGQQKGVDVRIGLDLVAHARRRSADVFFLVSGDDDLTEAVEEAQVHGVQVIVMAVPSAEDKPHGVSRHLIRACDELDLLPTELIDRSVLKVEVPRPAEPVRTPAAVPKPTPIPKPMPPKTASATPAAPAVPSPSDLALLKRPDTVAPTSMLAYTGATGGPSHVLPGYDEDDAHDVQIDAVVSRVLSAFKQSASVEDLANLRRSRPSIPHEIDRALLTDASEALEIYDLNEPIRYRLRVRFWEQVEATA